ncbi:AMP-binding protein [Christensenellaceae bacterium OttesenSCG-928-L17]|nr:AMP-binding protein [Christensenellaceae bacterium OttesenSCG-928-L17]
MTTNRIEECIFQLAHAEFHRLLNMTFGDLLDAQALRFPDNECVVEWKTGKRLTYAQFRMECDRVARGLLGMGLKKGSHMAVWTENSLEWLLLFFAATKIGVVFITVNTNYKRYELEYLLRQSDANTLVFSEGNKYDVYLPILLDICPGIETAEPGKLACASLPKLKNVVTLGNLHAPCAYHWDDFIALGAAVPEEDLQAAQAAVNPHDVANMQYTSGTTGFPKGVMLTHHGLINNGKSIGERKALTHRDRECIPVPLFHCFGCVLGVTSCVTHAATMVILERYQPLAVMEAVQEERCTSLLGVPTMFINILNHPDFKKFDYSSLRTGIMSGTPCPVEVMRRVNTEMHMPEIVIAFGMTESSPVTTMTAVDDPIEKRVSTVGRAQPNMEIRIVDPETGKDCAVGEPGEFITRGYQVMKGYYNMERATSAAIDSDGWLHTGDICSVDEDGYYRVEGRLKDMIIRGGENIYPRELEEYLYTHPAVSEAQVIGVPDETYGEEVLAYVILKDGHAATEDEIRTFMRTGLSYFKIPRYIRFIEEFPMTASGKIQKFKLRELGVELLGLRNKPIAKATLGRGKSESEAVVAEYMITAQNRKGGSDMTEQLMEIGIRLKTLREISDLSILEMAEAVHISEEEYIQYEHGEKDFAFSFLLKAAQVLQVDVADIMSGVSPRLSTCSLVRAGRGFKVERSKAYSYMALAHTFRDKRAEPFLVTVAPLDEMPTLHSHEGQEFQYLLEGEAKMTIGDSTFTIYPGDAVYFNSSSPHALTALGNAPAKFIAVVIT